VDLPSWSVHWTIPAGIGLVLALYALAIGPLRRRRGWGPPVPREQIICFATGHLVLFLALTGPIHDLSDSYLFTVHMLQHLIITLLVPPLLLVGTPDWLVRRMLAPRPLDWLARSFGRAPMAYLIFSLTLALWHVPVLYNSTLIRLEVHVSEHLMFIGSALIGWWPILAPAREYRAGMVLQLIYLLLIPFPMKIVGIMITLSDTVLYPAYAIAPRIWGITPLLDQQIGGMIMWVPAGFVFWIALAAHFFRWWEEARAQERGDTKIVPLTRERVT
jgi:putative membrane protein